MSHDAAQCAALRHRARESCVAPFQLQLSKVAVTNAPNGGGARGACPVYVRVRVLYHASQTPMPRGASAGAHHGGRAGHASSPVRTGPRVVDNGDAEWGEALLLPVEDALGEHAARARADDAPPAARGAKGWPKLAVTLYEASTGPDHAVRGFGAALAGAAAWAAPAPSGPAARASMVALSDDEETEEDDVGDDELAHAYVPLAEHLAAAAARPPGDDVKPVSLRIVLRDAESNAELATPRFAAIYCEVTG